MTRRKLVALVAALVLLTIGLVVLSTSLFLTHTDAGRAKLVSIGLPYLRNKFPNANIYVGKVGGTIISGVTIDSIAVRDKRGDLFLSTGRVTLEWNWRDWADNRIYITKANVEHPFLHIVQHSDYKWNFKEIFASANPPQAPPPAEKRTRNLLDYIVFDSVTARNTTFLLTQPWRPDSALRGAVRDSVIRAHLGNPAKAVSKTYDGYGRTYAWRDGHGLIAHARLADPDSDKFGRRFEIATLSVDEYEPTFKFRNLRGAVTLRGDTAEFVVPHFELPASTASGKGRVWWGSNLPVRYAIDIHGDSVSLDDVNWVYPTLPRTGGGTLDLAIRNDPADLSVVDFRIQKMDVRSTNSHLTGDMWFGTGAPVLLVRHVDLTAEPVTFDLLRTLAGKPFPYDWRGDIFGTVKARGGPLTRFYIDDARGRFEDAHVRGAVSRFAGKGELDILQPAYTAFHGFDVDVQSLDLRTIEYLNPAFPRIGGTLSGTARLDSSWLDVRFSNAHLALQNGPGEPSRFSGSGRVTNEAKFLIYDLALNAEPMNVTMLARSEALAGLSPLRGLYSGPLRIKGTAPDLEIAATLQGSAGAVSFEGRADIDSIGGRGAHGRGQFSNLDLAALLERESLPDGKLSGRYEVSLDSIGLTRSSIRGTADLDLDPTLVDSIRVRSSHVRVRFADGRLIVDSLRVHTDAFTAVARGGVGLPGGTPDSLRFDVTVDSLGGWRRIISHPDTTLLGARATKPDSLAGSVTITGVASGTFDTLDVRGRATGADLMFNAMRGDNVSAPFDFHNVLNRPTGAVDAHADSVMLAGVAFDSVGGRFFLTDSAHRQFSLGVFSRNGWTAVGGGRWSDSARTTTVVADSLTLKAVNEWRLAGPARVTFDSAALRVDSAVLRGRDSASVTFFANVPGTGPAFAQLRATAVPLADVGVLAQLSDTLAGVANSTVTATGTKLQPEIAASALLSGVRWGTVDSLGAAIVAHYHDRRVLAEADVSRSGRPALSASASWPYTVQLLFGLKQRNDSVRVAFRADSTDLSIVGLIPGLGRSLRSVADSLKGRISGDVQITGTTIRKTFGGQVAIKDGSTLVRPLGVTLRSINGRMSGGINADGQDSINLSFAARTSNRDSVALSGWLKNVASQNAGFALSLYADSLHAFNRRTVAELYLSTKDAFGRADPIRLQGTLASPTLAGSVNVDRGAIFLADRDLARKLSVETLAENAARTTTVSGTSALTTLMTNLQIAGVPVTLGRDVKLKSAEADVRLAGSLSLVKSAASARVVASTGQFVPGLSLEGALNTVSGTYTLNLGLVRREFNVLPNGTVTFDGSSSPETPLVDIRAQYNVKQFRDRDLGVIVNLHGRMPNPVIDFKGDADYTIATSDLVSYLLIGAPGFDFGADPQAAQVLSSFLSPTVSALAAAQLRRQFGSIFDAFRFELGTYNNSADRQNLFGGKNVQSYLNTARVGLEQQEIGRNLYLTVNTGFCDAARSLGGKVEYRFKPLVSLETAYDPPTSARTTCGDPQLATLTLAPTPGSVSFAIRRTWRF